ncbi:uncharacterized protein LOC114173534 [Vigna unguiculata]|uniref:uncharacterized protein LOC114173534 n=1 Tax=Vigna unguiculata TaxID=3917 RepID=UPI001016816E|nr:uncharacterized protein LOC114173534 [Vigna unguiculata]
MGRVYAMSGVEAAGLGNLVIGYCVIAAVNCCVLYDFGATHSFVSDACVKRLGLPVYCREKRLLFPDLKKPELVSSQGVMKEIQSGTQCFIIFTHMEVEEKEGTSVIPVVHEFEDVFPNEVPRLLPNREVDFSIDPVPGTSPVLMASYRMAPAELVELKKQIEELLRKQFI